jgi:hypothetical protein
MPPSLPGRLLLGAVLVVAPARLWGQPHDYAAEGGLSRHFAGGGELAAVVAPADNVAFFNYSDYERNVLRMARVRLFGEWRVAERLSALAELRTENADEVMLPALYLRWQPLAARELFVHAGRIPPVIGGFGRHAYGRDNVVIGQPLAYQYLTSLRPDALPLTIDDVLRMRARGWQPSYPVGSSALAPGVPLVSASKWDTGVAAIWRHGWLDLSAAATRGSPSVPVVRETNDAIAWSGRAAVRLPAGLALGVSGARGQWIADDVLAVTPDGRRRSSSQAVVATDAEFGRGPWLVRGEWLRSVFDVPLALAAAPDARLGAWSGFVETRYRPFPRWQFGVRVERLDFDGVAGGVEPAGRPSWDADVDRVEGVVGYRISRRLEVRAGWQQNWRDGGRQRERGLPMLALLAWF